MHKNFANTRFLGKSITSLPECHSTNDFMAQLAAKQQVSHGDILTAGFQTKGKGQRGNSWTSEKGKNLLFSIFLKPPFLKIEDIFLLNIIAGLAGTQLINDIVPEAQCQLKWPNDVYVKGNKISGILIETSISKQLDFVVAGIGFNVNQSHFALPTATSLKIETGKDHDLFSVLEKYAHAFENYYGLLESGEKNRVLRTYHDKMYWRGEVHTYRSHGEEFEAELIGINETGNLVLNCAGISKQFRTKEIEFVS